MNDHSENLGRRGFLTAVGLVGAASALSLGSASTAGAAPRAAAAAMGRAGTGPAAARRCTPPRSSSTATAWPPARGRQGGGRPGHPHRRPATHPRPHGDPAGREHQGSTTGRDVPTRSRTTCPGRPSPSAPTSTRPVRGRPLPARGDRRAGHPRRVPGRGALGWRRPGRTERRATSRSTCGPATRCCASWPRRSRSGTGHRGGRRHDRRVHPATPPRRRGDARAATRLRGGAGGRPRGVRGRPGQGRGRRRTARGKCEQAPMATHVITGAGWGMGVRPSRGGCTPAGTSSCCTRGTRPAPRSSPAEFPGGPDPRRRPRPTPTGCPGPSPTSPSPTASTPCCTSRASSNSARSAN